MNTTDLKLMGIFFDGDGVIVTPMEPESSLTIGPAHPYFTEQQEAKPSTRASHIQ